MNISHSNLPRLIALLPLGYSWATRLRSPRDVAYLIVTSWIPLIWIALREGALPAPQLATTFAAGYLAFISLYEIGYLANDVWDARRHVDGRKRGAVTGGPSWAVLFVGIRVATWAAIGLAMGWFGNPLWQGGYAVLLIVFAAHNLLRQQALRLATFAQLALLRFCLPLVAILDGAALAATAIVATLVYLPLRYLSYADSKQLLAMPERRSARFGATYLALTLPTIVLLSWILVAWSMVEVSLLLIAAHGVWAVGVDQRRGAKT